MVATVILLLVQLPPVNESLRTTEDPVQTTEGPVTAAGKALTEIVRVL